MKPGPIVAFSLVLAVMLPGVCSARTVSLPIRIDYSLLRSLVVASSFSAPGPSASVVDEDKGCRQVTLFEPTFGEKDGRIQFDVRVKVHSGMRVGDDCVLQVDWEGYLVSFQDPVIDSKTWRLHFATRDSVLLTLDRKPARLAGLVWELIKTRAYDYVNTISVDLSLPVGELTAFVQPLIEPSQSALQMIDRLQLGAVTVGRTAVVVPILLTLGEAFDDSEESGAGYPLDPGHREQFLETWEAWDEFLVSMITALAQRPLSEEDRQVLFDVLLDTRYRLTEALEAPSIREDFVRSQFVDAWRRLSSLFRAHLSEGSARTLLGYLAFFTASDALAALDGIGPALGFEISRDGLLRLIRLLGEGQYVGLEYRREVNISLRQALGVGPPIEVGDPLLHRGGTETGSGTEARTLAGWLRIPRSLSGGFLRSAWAAEAGSARKREDFAPWVPTADTIDGYFVNVRKLLAESIEQALDTSPLNVFFKELCLRVTPAIAWQESCMRQFEIEENQVRYLRSYNGTSVGIMQINERVWRGIYDQEKLRWNIAYNARAGSEIITLYLNRFLLPEAAKENPDIVLDEDLTARILHAMYNGGPGQFSRFLERHRQQRYYLSDRLFYEKYRWVGDGQWSYLRRCWGG